MKEILPLLCHPNYWIIHSIVYLFTILSDHLSTIDINCRVFPMLTPYLNKNIFSLSNKYLVLGSLNLPLNRNVYQIVMETKDSKVLDMFFLILQNEKSSDNNNVLYKRLLGENITQCAKSQLIKLSDLICKIYRNRRNYLANQNREYSTNVSEHNLFKFIRSTNLIDSSKDFTINSSTANQEWQHMFGPRTKDLMEKNGDTTTLNVNEVKETEYSYFDCPPYNQDVKMLISHKKSNFNSCSVSPSVIDSNIKFRPNGHLISHLYEHRASVNQLAKYSSTCFLSCSDDGTLRCWDLSIFENSNVLNKSKYMFKMEYFNGAPIHFHGIISCGSYIVTFTNDCNIYVFVIKETSIDSVCNFKVGCDRGSIPLFITSMCALSVNIFAVSLTNSIIYGYDIRNIQSKNFFIPIFKVCISPSQRTITSLDGSEIALFAGTACGYIAGFDLRFNLKVNSFKQKSPKSGLRISRVKYTTEGLYTSTNGSSDVTLWDYKLGGQKKLILKTSKSQLNKGSTIKAILPITGSSVKYSAVLTAGSDLRIRYWDLVEPQHSYIINDPSFMSCNHMSMLIHANSANSGSSRTKPTTTLSYFDHSQTSPLSMFISKAIDGVQGIEEIDVSNTFSQNKNSHFCILDQQSISNSHQDCVTDLLQVNQYLISSSRDGAIKVWR